MASSATEQQMQLPRAEQVHTWYRGSAELAKGMKSLVTAIEIIAAGLTVPLLTSALSVALEFVPLLVVGLGVVVAFARVLEDRWYGYSRRCRREALWAHARRVDIDDETYGDLELMAPILANRIGARLPAQLLSAYYGDAFADSDLTLRNAYGASAFFSWRLMRRASVAHAVAALVVFSIGFISLYKLVVQPADATQRAIVLDVIIGVVVTAVGIRHLGSAIGSIEVSRESHECLTSLMRKPAPTGEALRSVALRYEMSRMRGGDPPSTLYLWSRKRLADLWATREAK